MSVAIRGIAYRYCDSDNSDHVRRVRAYLCLL